MQGWKVMVGLEEIRDQTWPAVKAEIHNQLYRISRVVAAEPLAKLRQITIWVHLDDPATPCAAYHPGAEWLTEHGSDPRMAKGLEISNAKNFIAWTHEQPWMVLHELSHGYNDHFMADGLDSPIVKSAYDQAMASHLYDSVLHYDGKLMRAYAATNQKEYFAECTEAYFGQNDFYPFVKAELKQHDPGGYQLMESVWGQPARSSPGMF